MEKLDQLFLFLLYDILDKDVLECWCHFVLDSHILCSKKISCIQLQLADSLLLQFCRRTERLLDKEASTPNMHMHALIQVCIVHYTVFGCLPLKDIMVFLKVCPTIIGV